MNLIKKIVPAVMLIGTFVCYSQVSQSSPESVRQNATQISGSFLSDYAIDQRMKTLDSAKIEKRDIRFENERIDLNQVSDLVRIENDRHPFSMETQQPVNVNETTGGDDDPVVSGGFAQP